MSNFEQFSDCEASERTVDIYEYFAIYGVTGPIVCQDCRDVNGGKVDRKLEKRICFPKTIWTFEALTKAVENVNVWTISWKAYLSRNVLKNCSQVRIKTRKNGSCKVDDAFQAGAGSIMELAVYKVQ